jgi:hypothetical protein
MWVAPVELLEPLEPEPPAQRMEWTQALWRQGVLVRRQPARPTE